MLKLSTEGSTHINIWMIINKKDKKKISCTLTHSSIKHRVSNDENHLYFRRGMEFYWKGTMKNKNGRKFTPMEKENSPIFRTCYDLFSVVGIQIPSELMKNCGYGQAEWNQFPTAGANFSMKGLQL